MKIKITDFGPIKEFEFDLNKSFIGIFGKNNTGKSYAISAAYLILKQLFDINSIEITNLMKLLTKEIISKHKKNLEEFLSLEQNENNITKEFESFFKDIIFKNFTEKLTDSFYSTFGDLEKLKNIFSKNYPKIILNFDFLEATFIIEKEILIDKVILKQEIIVKNTASNENSAIRKDKIILCLAINNNNSFNIDAGSHLIMSSLSFFEEVRRAVTNVYYMPVARTGLYQALSSYSEIFAELSKQRRHITEKFEIPRLSEPVSDYFLRLSQIDVNQKLTIRQAELYKLVDGIDSEIIKGKEALPVIDFGYLMRLSKRDAKRKHITDQIELNKVIEDIEQEIIKGKVSFDDKDKRIYYSPDNSDVTIEISNASSMVSELAPIVLYLKHIIPYRTRSDNNYNNIFSPLIFIEEPEAHLHPKVQLQLTEIFCRLTKIGVKIVITSHSNNIFTKMNNLILSKDLLPKNVEVSVFEETKTGSIVKKSKIDELGIDDDNFLETAEELFKEKMNLIDKLNDENDNR